MSKEFVDALVNSNNIEAEKAFSIQWQLGLVMR